MTYLRYLFVSLSQQGNNIILIIIICFVYIYVVIFSSSTFSDSGPYISELLSRITDDAVKQNISTFLIARSQLDIGDLIGKGLLYKFS